MDVIAARTPSNKKVTMKKKRSPRVAHKVEFEHFDEIRRELNEEPGVFVKSLGYKNGSGQYIAWKKSGKVPKVAMVAAEGRLNGRSGSAHETKLIVMKVVNGKPIGQPRVVNMSDLSKSSITINGQEHYLIPVGK